MSKSFIYRALSFGGDRAILARVFNVVDPRLGGFYNRSFSSLKNDLGNASYRSFNSHDAELVQRLKVVAEEASLQRISSANKQVMKTVRYEPISKHEDNFGKIVIGSKDDVVVRYGDCGILPSNDVRPDDLLKYKLVIPKEDLGILTLRHHTPFFYRC